MKLIHLTELADRQSCPSTEPVRLQFSSGMGMSQCIHTVQTFCHSDNRDKNKSLVVWDTNHHEILLWFEEEKYGSYFLLRMETKGA